MTTGHRGRRGRRGITLRRGELRLQPVEHQLLRVDELLLRSSKSELSLQIRDPGGEAADFGVTRRAKRGHGAPEERVEVADRFEIVSF